MVVLLGVASGKCLSHNDGALMNGFMVPRSLLFQPPACMLSLESYPTSCDPMDFSPPGFSVHGFSRQEYWSGQPFPSPGDLPDPGTEPRSPALQVDSLLSGPPEKCNILKRGK